MKRKINWWNGAAATATGAILGMAQAAATGAAVSLQNGETDAKKIGKAAIVGALIAFGGWVFPTFKKADAPQPDADDVQTEAS